MRLIHAIAAVALFLGTVGTSSCDQQPSSDTIQRRQQETLLQEGTAQIGMPAIKNFRERKLLKDILELRDQNGLVTYTYVYGELTTKLRFLCTSVGYGIPYATEFTNPQKMEQPYSGHG